jgi:molybdate transport system ATP-binding protein
MPEPLTNPEESVSPVSRLSVSVRGLRGNNFALEVEFCAPPGITILFGPSGSGKTTLLNCVAGLATPATGRISAGERVLFDSARQIDMPVARRGIGYVFQDLALFPHLSVGGNVEYGLGHVSAAERASRSERMLQSFRIAHLRRRKPRDISGGERQRVALARALVTDPCVLLLDEPLSGLDTSTRSRLLQDLHTWNEAHCIPVLYVTHAREEVFALGERVLVLQEGRLLAQGSPYEVLEKPRHEAIAELTGVENLFDGTVLALHETQGTLSCRLCDVPEGKSVELEVPLAHLQPGMPIRVGIRAGDILLATTPLKGISARNILPGRLTSLRLKDTTVIAEVDCGVEFEVHLTPAAQQALELLPGKEVWLVIKTHSCHLLRSSS